MQIQPEPHSYVLQKERNNITQILYILLFTPPPNAGANLCRFPVCKNEALLSAVVSGNFHQNSAKPRNMTLGGISHRGGPGGRNFSQCCKYHQLIFCKDFKQDLFALFKCLRCWIRAQIAQTMTIDYTQYVCRKKEYALNSHFLQIRVG